MCFSAIASFGAATVITTVGVVAYKKADKKPLRLLALIPVFFGIQQFFEGIVWLSSMYDDWSFLLKFSTYGFIFFAWIIWPIYIPFTLWKIEKNFLRKKIIFAFLPIGFFVVSAFMYVALNYGVSAEIKDCSILYNIAFEYEYSWIVIIMYLTSTTFSPLFSSINKVWVLGILNLITYFVSKIYYHDHLTSVWCFLAAISSLVILWIITSENNSEKKMISS